MTLIIVQGTNDSDYVEYWVCNSHDQAIADAVAAIADAHKLCDTASDIVSGTGTPAIPVTEPWAGIANFLLRNEQSRQELWSNVFGSEGESWSWWLAMRYSKGADWDKIGEVTLTVENPDEPEGLGVNPITKTLTISDVAAAYAKAIAGGYKIIPINPEDGLDAMSADVVLQYAVLGDVVYG